jgi:hypothetical protein
MIVLAPISVGELIDKITILQIKQERIQDSVKLKNVLKELYQLIEIHSRLLTVKQLDDTSPLFHQLYYVNNQLWDIEDSKRKHEREQNFTEEFVQLARQVYLKNDLRAKIKRDINLIVGSEIVEEKSY